jgi:hypothetical protein
MTDRLSWDEVDEVTWHGDDEQLDAWNEADHPRDPNGEFANGYDLSNEVDSELLISQTLRSPMSQAEEEAVAAYSENEYFDINKGLRHGVDLGDNSKVVEEMDRVFARASTSVPLTVYRQVDKDTYERIASSNEYVDRGFVSATAKRSLLPASNVVRLHLPAGTRAIPIGHLSSRDATEAEVIVDRGYTYSVTHSRHGMTLTPVKRT